MPRKRFTEEQIAFALRQHEGGPQIAEIIRKLGVTEQTFYRWKKKFAGLGVAELRRQRTSHLPSVGLPTFDAALPERSQRSGRTSD